MKHRLSFALLAVCALAFGATLLSACGGRFQTVREVFDDEGGSSSGGNANSNAGRGGALSSRAGSNSAGWSNGATSSGASSSGGASTGSGGSCAQLKCAFPSCPAGSAPVIPPGGCCPVCQSACPPCPAIMCPAGSHAQVLDGCCPVCIVDDPAVCMNGQRAYASFRNELLNKYQYGCASDAECTVIAPVNRCENGCGFTAVWYGASDSFDSNLSNAADMYCSTCAQGPIPPCAPPSPVGCVGGQCRFLTLK